MDNSIYIPQDSEFQIQIFFNQLHLFLFYLTIYLISGYLLRVFYVQGVGYMSEQNKMKHLALVEFVF